MKKGILTIINTLVLAAVLVSPLVASASELYNTRQGMYTFYKINTLQDSDFEFYFSIDTCSDMEEYITINFSSEVPRKGGVVHLASSNGEHEIKLEGVLQPGDKGHYLMFTVNEEDGVVASEILRGENIEIKVIEKDGNVIELRPHQEGLNLIGNIHEEYYR